MHAKPEQTVWPALGAGTTDCLCLFTGKSVDQRILPADTGAVDGSLDNLTTEKPCLKGYPPPAVDTHGMGDSIK